uniref:type IX secretion system outer membrane channel protein PorV n=2 Tax=Roseivirga sp. TaxID=1964215 RepID=UPI004048CBD6
MKINIRVVTIPVLASIFSFPALAQNSGVISGQDTARNVITTAVPFLTIAPDPISGAMGDVGAATAPNSNAIHWNPAKLAYLNKDYGFAASYTPWLSKFVDDMSISYLSGYKKLNDNQAFGIALTYFDLGEIQLTDGAGNNLQIISPKEFAIAGTYSQKLSTALSIGVTGRFINSNLSGNITTSPVSDPKPGTSIAADIGVYYKSEKVLFGKPSQVAFGGVMSNIGAKISYNSADEEDFIPTNLRLGTAISSFLDPYNKVTFALDLNKLMVPTPQPNGSHRDKSLIAGMFGSFGDAPNGFKEELQEFMISIGMEYEYKETFAIRTGYFSEHQNKGNRKYFTAGVGFKVKAIGVDFAYLVPTLQEHPLAETLRFGMTYNIDKKAK